MNRLLGSVILSVCLLSTPIALAGHPVPVAPSDAAAFEQRLAAAHWIAEGATHPEHIVYVFLDPSCPYCNALWHQISAVKRPGLQVRYLLVAVISDDSRDKAAAILEAPQPANALAQHEERFTQGGLAAHPPKSATTDATLTANQLLMQDLHIQGTPGEAWMDAGARLAVFTGMPDPAQLAQMLGTAEGSVK